MLAKMISILYKIKEAIIKKKEDDAQSLENAKNASYNEGYDAGYEAASQESVLGEGIQLGADKIIGIYLATVTDNNSTLLLSRFIPADDSLNIFNIVRQNNNLDYIFPAYDDLPAVLDNINVICKDENHPSYNFYVANELVQFNDYVRRELNDGHFIILAPDFEGWTIKEYDEWNLTEGN